MALPNLKKLHSNFIFVIFLVIFKISKAVKSLAQLATLRFQCSVECLTAVQILLLHPQVARKHSCSGRLMQKFVPIQKVVAC